MTLLVTSDLFLLPASKGGRLNPIVSGYRCKANFFSRDKLLVTKEVSIEFPNGNKIYPDEKFRAHLKLVTSQPLFDVLQKASKVVLKEGNKEIGSGKITGVKDLKQDDILSDIKKRRSTRSLSRAKTRRRFEA